MGWLKNMIKNWLNIQPAMQSGITILEPMSVETNAMKNQIWYRGDASELDQLYKQLNSDYVGRSRFWAAAPENENIRKMHSGLPSVMVDTLAYIVKADMSDVMFEKEAGKADWEEICKELDFVELIGDAVVGTLVTGDGAFKISADTELSPYPMVEFFPADRVDYITKRGRIVGVNFYTNYAVGRKTYRLQECYTESKIAYTLFDGDKEVPLSCVPELREYETAEFNGKYMLAIPFRIYKSAKYADRGKSIFESKTDEFDAHDEVISQWMDALRAGRVQKYIPEDLIPRDEKTGGLLSVNSFGTNFVKIDSAKGENADPKIDTIQPEIRYEAFLSTYCSTLDRCLQGIMSPATLGIDLGKMSSADAQREKKDITGHTRNAITSALEKSIPKLVAAILMTYDNMRGNEVGAYEPSISFGEYGAPDFDSRVETVNKAATANTMSIETQVDELWGDSKDEKWKAEEVLRIKRDKGIAVVEEPELGDDLP